jgi:GT2 family glycosyltransferase
LPDSRPLVTTIILNWNGIEDTRECLESLRTVDYPNNRILVVDNGSEQDEASLLEQEYAGFLEVFRNERNLGFAGGANVGMRRALEDGTDFVLLLNNDVTADPGFLEAMVSFAEGRSDFAAGCPKAYFNHRRDVIYSTGGSVNVWTGVARQIGRGERDSGQFDRAKARDYADGLCMLIPVSALKTVGLLDEDYFNYWEETDWCVRARDKGLRCYYVPEAKVWHKAEQSRRASDAFNFHYRRNSLMFVRKRGGPLHLATALAAQALYYAPLYFIRHPRRLGRAVAELRAVVWHLSNRVRRRPLL